MCDYSLCGIPNRLATEGDELVLHRFRTGSMGMASVTDIEKEKRARALPPNAGWWARVKRILAVPPVESVPAICVPPGARLIIRDIPDYLRQQLGGLETEEQVLFVQTSLEVNTYRDAIQFRNGRQVRLQNLPTGLSVDVLALRGPALEYRGA